MVQPLYQWYTFGRGKEIFSHDIAELVIRDVLNVVCRNVGNLAESVITPECPFAAIKDSFPLQIGLPVKFAGFAVLIGYIPFIVRFRLLDCKPEAGFFGKRLQYLFPDVFHIREVFGDVICDGFRNHFLPDIVRAAAF